MDYALKVLNLSPGYTLDQLRTNYKSLALRLHPDKCQLGDDRANAVFNVLTESYKVLKQALEAGPSTASDADWLSLRTDSAAAAPSDPAPAPMPSSCAGQGERFDVDRFNSRFAETRLGDENDRGYGGWMKRLSPDDAAARQRRLQEHERRAAAADATKAIVDVPEPLPSSTTVPYSELGVQRVRDFGRPAAEAVALRRVLNYTDYRVAHMTAPCLIDPATVRARQTYSSLEDYERSRGDASTLSATDGEKEQMERIDRANATREDRRVRAMHARDEAVERHNLRVGNGSAIGALSSR